MKWSDPMVLIGLGMVLWGAFAFAIELGLMLGGAGLIGVGLALGKAEDGADNTRS